MTAKKNPTSEAPAGNPVVRIGKIAGCLLVVAAAVLMGPAESAARTSDRKALGRFAGKYDGKMCSVTSREVATGNLVSFTPSIKSFARIPRGRKGFRIEGTAAFRLIFFGRITKAKVRNGGAAVRYRGRFHGFQFFTTAGSAVTNGSGSFKATARERGGKEKLTGKINFLSLADPANPNRVTANFVSK